MEKQATVVQIDRSNSSKPIIHNEVFCMDEAGGILVNFDPCVQKRRVVSAGHFKNVAFIRNMGSNNPNVNTGLCSIAQCSVDSNINDKVRCGDIDVVFCFANHVQIDCLSNGFMVERRICVRLHIAGPGTDWGSSRSEMIKILVLLADIAPHG